MSDKGIILSVTAAVAIFALVGWLTIGVWRECRAEGHSFFYCLRLVSR